MSQHEVCRIQVRFADQTLLAYRADRTAAALFAEAVRPTGTTVTIDDQDAAALPPLPCERLWH